MTQHTNTTHNLLEAYIQHKSAKNEINCRQIVHTHLTHHNHVTVLAVKQTHHTTVLCSKQVLVKVIFKRNKVVQWSVHSLSQFSITMVKLSSNICWWWWLFRKHRWGFLQRRLSLTWCMILDVLWELTRQKQQPTANRDSSLHLEPCIELTDLISPC